MADYFETLAVEAIKKAEAHTCTFAAFVAGLESMVVELQDRLELAREELAQRERESQR